MAAALSSTEAANAIAVHARLFLMGHHEAASDVITIGPFAPSPYHCIVRAAEVSTPSPPVNAYAVGSGYMVHGLHSIWSRFRNDPWTEDYFLVRLWFLSGECDPPLAES